MWITLLLCGLIYGQVSDVASHDVGELAPARWRRILSRVAEQHELVRETDGVALKLETRPVYTWSRPGDDGGTYGNIFVWTDHGNVEAVACFWRAPTGKSEFIIFHELHSLSPSVLKSNRTGPHQWTAKVGLNRSLVPDAPLPAANSVGRLQQMREICRNFAAHSISSSGERTELRLLPQPLYRYQSTIAELVDGALFAFVCTVGTDPEIFLQLEVRATQAGPKWHYSLARFSHQNLFVSYQSDEIWSAIRDAENPIAHNAPKTYWLFSEPFDSQVLEPDAPQ